MRSLVYAGVNDVQWREAPDARLLDGEDALVRPVASATCDLDRYIVAGRTPFPAPFAIGHEAVGEVVEVGDGAGAAGLQIGQRVVVPWHHSCERCLECLAGRPGNCLTTPNMAAFGNPMGGLNGGLFDDLVRVPFAAGSLPAVPDGVSSAMAAACGDSLCDAYGAVAPTLRGNPHAAVLVMGGLESLGLLVVAAAAALGASQVVYVDDDIDRTERATALGATSVVTGARPDRVDGQFDLAVEAAEDPDALATAMRSVRPGGHLVIRSIYFTPIPLPHFDQYLRSLTIESGLPHVTPHASEVLDLLASGTLDLTAVLSTFDLDMADAVMLDLPATKPVFLREAD